MITGEVWMKRINKDETSGVLMNGYIKLYHKCCKQAIIGTMAEWF